MPRPRLIDRIPPGKVVAGSVDIVGSTVFLRHENGELYSARLVDIAQHDRDESPPAPGAPAR